MRFLLVVILFSSLSAKAEENLSVQVMTRDGSVLAGTLGENSIEFDTGYGQLKIPLSDIERIEFGSTAETSNFNSSARRTIETQNAANSLRYTGHAGFNSYNFQPCRVSDSDAVYIGESKITGKILLQKLAFKNESLHIDGLDRSSICAVAVNAQTGGGEIQNATAYAHLVGSTFKLKLTGSAAGTCYGTDAYTTDSNVATCAVHAGVLKRGEKKDVKIKILAAQPVFLGSFRNGVTSQIWQGLWPAFQFETQ